MTDLGLPTPPPGTPWEQLDMIANTFFVVALLILLFVLGSRNLKRLPETKFQMLLEICIGVIVNFFGGILGKHGKQYSWFVGSYFIFILFLNYLGLIPGFQSPTADLNTTVAFGLIAVIGVNLNSYKAEMRAILRILRQQCADEYAEPLWITLDTTRLLAERPP